jgi:hypothetical protein
MQGTILLNYNENTHQVEEEEKSRFLREFLENTFESSPDVSTQIKEIWDVDGPLSAPQKVKMRNILNTYNVMVIDDLDGHMKIYVDNELMAEWLKCSYKLRKDLQVTDPQKRIYLEMHVECWSVFDSQETGQETE